MSFGILEMSFDLLKMSFDLSKMSFDLFEKSFDALEMSFSLFDLKFDQYYDFYAHFVSVFDVNDTKISENCQKKVTLWVRGNEFCCFGNEFHRFGNEFSHFGGNEFRPKRTKKSLNNHFFSSKKISSCTK